MTRTPGAPLQEEARALGDPTRYAIFRNLLDADDALGVAELTERFGLNHNAIRQHLAKLVQAGLVTETQAASAGRGRPRLEYRVRATAESRWGAVGPYERLSLLLTEIVRTGDTATEVGRRAGHGARSRIDARDQPVAFLVDAMDREGFEPKVRRRDDALDISLRTCPFESTALADPETVCAIHLGIAQGLADRTDGLIAVEELVPHDPRLANCRLRVRISGRGSTDPSQP